MTIAIIRSQIKNHWLNILGLALFFAVLRWNSFNAPLIRDEGEYAYAAQLLVQGVAPYEHAFVQKPPMVIYSYALSGLLLPHIFWAPRLLAYLFVALATILLGYIAWLEFGKDIAWPAMWLVTPMILLPGIEQFPANTEMFMLLPLLATVAVYVHSRHHGQNLKHWLAAGFLGVTTLCYKYTTLPVLAAIYAAWSVEIWRQTRSPKLVWQSWLAAIFGGLLAVMLELGFFLVHDGGARLWECTVRFNHYYIQSSNFGLNPLWFRLKDFLAAWWILFLVPPAALVKPNPRIWFWSGLMVCAVLATGASYYGHYYIVVMPFWALLSALGIHALAVPIARWLNRQAKWIGGTITALVLLLIMLPDAPWLMRSPEQFAAKKMGGWSPFLESQQVAGRVAELSSPGDYVFVAGSEPQILYYARRFSPTRFVIVYPFMIPSPVARNYQAEAIHDLQEHPPRLIVVVQSTTSWLQEEATPPEFLIFLKKLLLEDYDRAGGYVLDGQKGRWSEPLTDAEAATSSLVLFKRKNPHP